MRIDPGQFVESDSNQLGIGKLIGIKDGIAKVHYFDSPADNKNNYLTVPVSSLSKKDLFPQTRVFYYNRTKEAWQAGRFVLERNGLYEVRFPNKEDLILSESEIFVRWNLPISDPSQLLALRINETPFFHGGRHPFIKALIGQRGGCVGMSGLFSAIIDLEAHQVEVVRRVLQDPVQRYLLADEVGLGKTIEAGAILRQYVLNNRTDHKALIIIPEHLRDQWYDELSCKFLLSHYLDKTIHLVSNKDYQQIRTLGKDVGMVIIDEAHQVAALLNSSTPSDTNNFEIIKSVAHDSDRLLLLSATPVLHNERSYLAMLHLLDPTIYSLDDFEKFKDRIEKRQEIAESFHTLHEESPNFFIEDVINDIGRAFPNDRRLQKLIEDLKPRIAFDASEDDADRARFIKSIRVHLSEVYRLHRRLLRNRRTSDLEDLVPGREGFKRIEYQDPILNWLEQSLDEWRIAALDSVYGREETLEAANLSKLVWVIFEIAICDLTLLPMALKVRLGDNLGVIELPFTKEVIKIIKSTPCFEGEMEVLKDILLNLDEEQDARLKVLEQFFLENAGDDSRYIVFTNFPESADRIFEHLLKKLDPSQVLRHKVRSQNDCTIEGKIFICDRTAEEGLNLQGGKAVMVHYDLPLSPNRIEQRLGRLDRFGVAEPVVSIGLIAHNAPFQNAWVNCLTNAFGVFNRSIASLQYVTEDWMTKTSETVLFDGSDAINDSTIRLGGTEGLLNVELAKIKKQDELDAIDTLQEDDRSLHDRLWDADFGWNEFERATNLWLKNRLHFCCWGESGPKDKVIRYQYRSDGRGPITLVPMDELFDRFKNILDIEYSRYHRRNPSTFPITFKRQTARSRNVHLARIGEPFIDALMRYVRKDDRGVSYAMWRYIPNFNLEDEFLIAFRFDFLVEVDTTHAVALLNQQTQTNSEALKHKSDTFLPPFMRTIWIDENLQPIIDTDLLEVLSCPYSNKRQYIGGIDYNLNPIRWQAIDSLIDPTYWYAICQSTFQNAKEILLSDSEVKDYLQEGVSRTIRTTSVQMDQLRSRIGYLNDRAKDIEKNQIEIEEALNNALIKGIKQPSIILDAAGAIILSYINPFNEKK